MSANDPAVPQAKAAAPSFAGAAFPLIGCLTYLSHRSLIP